MHWTKDVSDKNCIVCINAITDAHYNVIGCRCHPFCNFLSLRIKRSEIKNGIKRENNKFPW